ncbi:hypothetical protein ACP4OV_004021 [Aristida adscensionis]
MPRTVAVVGAGAAGLAAARELLREGLAVAVFEKSGRAGGTWAYDPRADADPLGRDPASPGAVHGSLYASLRTNLPRELMGFSDFPLAGRVFAGDARTFPGHREVLAFLDAFAEESGVAARIRLHAEVLRVQPLGPDQGQRGGRWRGEGRPARWRRRCSTPSSSATATGRCLWCPRSKESRTGKCTATTIEFPNLFEIRNVVIVGLGASGIDIATEILRVAKSVHIAARYSEGRLGKIELYQNAWMHAEVDCIQDDGKVRFADGSVVAADAILYCTGYHYSFPFLDLDGFIVDDNRVGPLYKHVFPPKYAPSLSFTIVFQSLELESKWVAAVLSGKAALPSEEGMVAAVQEHHRRMEEAGRPKRHTHVMMMPGWEEHMNWLAEQVGDPHLDARRCEMFEKAIRCLVSLREGYTDRWEDEEAVEENGGAASAS